MCVFRKSPVRRRVKLFLPPAMISLALLMASSLAGLNAYADSSQSVLREKDVKRGEAVLAKLRGFEQQRAAARGEQHSYEALVRKAYPALFVQVAELRESDLKTDLTTAVFLYEEAMRAGEVAVHCDDEVRDVYARLCVESGSATVAEFLRARARLHTAWAGALINYHRGARDEATTAALEEMRRQRRLDLALGERAVAALQILEKDVCAYASLGEFEEQKTVARKSFKELSVEMAEVLRRVDLILQSLPRGPIFHALYRARNAYDNGVFWWEKTYRRGEKVVNVNSFTEPNDLKAFGMDASAVNYTVVTNWRNAARHTQRAATIIESLKTEK